MSGQQGLGGIQGLGVMAKGYRASFGADENILKLTMGMGAQACEDHRGPWKHTLQIDELSGMRIIFQ